MARLKLQSMAHPSAFSNKRERLCENQRPHDCSHRPVAGYVFGVLIPALKIAQRFNAGNPGHVKHRVPSGTTEARLNKNRSTVPKGTLTPFQRSGPSVKTLGYFQKAKRLNTYVAGVIAAD